MGFERERMHCTDTFSPDNRIMWPKGIFVFSESDEIRGRWSKQGKRWEGLGFTGTLCLFSEEKTAFLGFDIRAEIS